MPFVLGFQVNSICCLHFLPFTHVLVLAKILQNGAKFIQELTPAFKCFLMNLGKFKQAIESPKCLNSMGYFCQKI